MSELVTMHAQTGKIVAELQKRQAIRRSVAVHTTQQQAAMYAGYTAQK
jgi:hypothetical protein